MSVFEGNSNSRGGRFAIVVSRYNRSITSKLLDGAIDTFKLHGISEHAIEIAWVPGAWEIPVVASHFAQRGAYDAIVCLGAVIRGETTHDQYINQQVSATLANLAVQSSLPVLFGILTCDNLEQAIHRSGGRVGNKGVECAEAALEMASLLTKLRESSD